MEQTRKYILKQVASGRLSQEEAMLMLNELKVKPAAADEDIAIIGMACKLPGAGNYHQFWSNLKNGVTCIGEFPAERRKDADIFYSDPHLALLVTGTPVPEGTDLGEIYSKMGYLDEIDKFDAGFFRIPPREAKFIDPAQRVFLEAAWEAVEDAGYGGDRIYGTKTGVFVGRDHTNPPMYKLVTQQDQMHLTGSWTGIMASRISYIFNLKGPGVVIDTACSSGLTAVHNACHALKIKECDMAIAGGINLGMLPRVKTQQSDMGMVESEDNTVRSFDRHANGTVWGEGVGAVLLKPLSRAIADRDNIYAVIKGSAVNNDGASNGITSPNAEAQEDVIIRAWKDAKINPETISYVEAHGTGTVLGDPIEVKGLTNAFRKYTQKKQFCGIGSVKTSIGHTVGASGVASLIKVVLSIKHGMIPANINFEEPNPYINFCDSPVYITDRLEGWKNDGGPKRAGVNSFGFSGTNCHVVLEEYPGSPKAGGEENSLKILALSAKNENVMKELVKKYVEFAHHGREGDLRDICYTANTGRGHYNCRLALVIKDYADFREKIFRVNESGLNEINEKGVYYGEHRLVPDNKKTRRPGESSGEDIKQASEKADSLIRELNSAGGASEAAIDEICRLYTGGAQIEWEALYKGQDRKRVSVPVYPLERVRYWAEPRRMEIQGASGARKTDYPLLDSCIADSMDRQTYSTMFSPNRHWVLRDHRVMGYCVVPGTAYVEMALEACKGCYSGMLELKDVIFITPLAVNDGEAKEAQIIVKKEKDYLEFYIAGLEEGEKWAVYSEGKAFMLQDTESRVCDLEGIKLRCSLRKPDTGSTASNGVFEFGPRWRNIDKIYKGEDEALVELKLPEELTGDLREYLIHPAMLDNAVNIAIQHNGIYLPLSYGSLKLYNKMPENFFSHVRRKGEEAADAETVTFDISLLDETGKVFAEISDYTIKRVHDTGGVVKGAKKPAPRKENKAAYDKKDSEEAVIKGAGDEELSATEKKMTQIWVRVLELKEVDIYESFSDLGGDSILAAQLLKEVDKEYPGLVNIGNIFSYPSVVQLAQYIDEKQGTVKKEQPLAEDTEKDNGKGFSDQDLKDLLESLETGDGSIESGLELLSERRKKI